MKDPAFLFYVADFNDGTQDFTDEEVGAYLRLLLFQFSQGHLPLDRIKKRLGINFERLWPVLFPKFKIDSEGLFFNQRLEDEQLKRKAYSDSRRQNISKRYEKDMNYTCNTHVVHMENENEDVNKDIVIDKKGVEISEEKPNPKKDPKPKNVFIPPTIEEVRQYFTENGYRTDTAEKAFNYYSTADWKDSKGNQVKNWKQKMIAVWFKDENKAGLSGHPTGIKMLTFHDVLEISKGDPVGFSKYVSIDVGEETQKYVSLADYEKNKSTLKKFIPKERI